MTITASLAVDEVADATVLAGDNMLTAYFGVEDSAADMGLYEAGDGARITGAIGSHVTVYQFFLAPVTMADGG